MNFSLGFYIWHQRKTRQNSADSESSQLPSKIFSEKSLEFESASKDIKENNIRDNLVLDQKIEGKNVFRIPKWKYVTELVIDNSIS